MKTQRTVITILSLVILLSLPAIIAAGQGEKYADLLQTAREKGFVRVIACLEVPGIDTLTAESNHFMTGITEAAYVQAAYNADLNLEKAIGSVADKVLQHLNGREYSVNHTFSTLPCLALTLSPEAVSRLMDSPGIVALIEDRPIPLSESWTNNVKDKISFPQLQQSTEIVGAKDAWSLGYTGKGWFVAILDTGIYKAHEFFTGKTIVEQCYSVEKDCPNGQGSMSGPGSAVHVGENPHGSHVSGIAAGNNKKDKFGVAKDADIMAVQIFSYIEAWDDVGSYTSDQIKGLEYVYQKRNQYKIAAANMSLGSDAVYASYCNTDYWNALIKGAIDNLKAAGIATAVASGNSDSCNGVSAPACISTAITVCSTDKRDYHYLGANWQDTIVDLLAPGVEIVSATADAVDSYQAWTGTSMATPHVTGAWAILKQFSPTISVDNALKALKDNGTLITNRCGSGVQKSRINIDTAIMSMYSLVPPLSFKGEKKANQSLLQTEYIDVLTWEANPLNAAHDQTITHYRIYTVDGSNNLTFLAEVTGSTLSYWNRKVSTSGSLTYAIKSVNDQGELSISAYTTVE